MLIMASQVLRLGAGMLVFVLLARALGPSDFGSFSYALAMATLVSVIVNYGLVTFSLREIGAKKEEVDEMLGSVLAAKFIFFAISIFIAVAVTFFLNENVRTAFLLLFGAQIVESFSEFYNVVFRINMRGREESLNASIISGFHVGVFFSFLMFGYWTLDSACVVFLMSRIFGLFWTLYSTRKINIISIGGWLSGVSCARQAWAYALEIFVNTAYTQFDSVIILSYVGPTGLGIYQAGMKLVQGASRIAPMLAQTVLPNMAESHRSGVGFLRIAGKSVSVFLVAGCVIGAPLVLFKEAVVRILFGAHYSGVTYLMPVFALILAMRYLETGCGLVLVAMGLQSKKVVLVVMQLLILVVTGVPMMKFMGVAGWSWAIVVSTLFLLGAYFVLFLRGLNNEH